VEPDRKEAKWLHSALETYRVPRKLVQEESLPPRLGRVFRDEEELPASGDLSREIETALVASRYLIVVCSRRTPESEWVNKEVVRFRELGRDERILALLIDGEPSEAFPVALREIRRTVIDEHGLAVERIEEVEPLAADIRQLPSRPDRPRYLRRMARLRLLACILGCTFDDLRRREQERQTRRMAALSATAAAILLCVATVVSVAYVTTTRAMNRAAEEQRSRALAQVDGLCRAEMGQVPFILENLKPVWPDVAPRLREPMNRTDLSEKERLRLSLALLPDDAKQTVYLHRRLFDVDPADFLVIRDALVAHAKEVAEPLWDVALATGTNGDRRFRAACALAKLDAQSQEAKSKWNRLSNQVVRVLCAQSPLVVGTWVEALRPVRQTLVPALQSLFRDANASEAERPLAVSILADYAADQPDVLADTLMDADAKQFGVLLPALQAHSEKAARLLEDEVGRQVAADAKEQERQSLASRQANAAAALLRLNQSEKAWQVFQHCPNPTARSYLIHRVSPAGVDPKVILTRLDRDRDVSLRRALLLSLGEYDEDRLPLADRQQLIPKLLDLYRDDPDPGAHGAMEWLLRQWKQGDRLKGIDQHLATGKAEGNRGWYVSGQGQTMVLIGGPVEFLMGSPATEPDRHPAETRHKRRIGRNFAIGAKEVTVEQFERFLRENPDVDRGSTEYRKRFYPDPAGPIGSVTWYEAAAYCNWLSKKEGVPQAEWCYEANAEGKFTQGMRPAAGYLERAGYRLPSEAEWEYACRAGSQTSRYFGAGDVLLTKYAWYLGNSSDRAWPVGGMKPNDLGLFDTLGNAFEWCHGRILKYPPGSAEDTPDSAAVSDREGRVLRGGSSGVRARSVRCGAREADLPAYRVLFAGFRTARTLR